MDSQGLAFHLPALILAELHDEGDGNLPFRLGAANRQRDWLWDALSCEQRLAVRDFLLWASENSDWEADRELFRQGLGEFWSLSRIQDGEQVMPPNGP